MKRYILALVVLLSAMVSESQPVQLLDSAAQYYSDGKYELAISTYEKILDDGYEAAGLYYNLGNAYFKSNKIPQAILNYERAKKLSAKDEDIDFNLKLANTHVIDKIDVVPEFFLSSWRNKLIKVFSTNEWAIISLSAFLLGLSGLLLFFLSGRRGVRRMGFWIGVFLLILSLFTFRFSAKQHKLQFEQPEAIIMTPSVVVKSSPSEGGTDLFLIHEGLKVRVTDSLGDWREVKLSDGNEGWVKEKDLEVI